MLTRIFLVNLSHLQKSNLELIQNTSKYTETGKADVAEAEEHLDTFQMQTTMLLRSFQTYSDKDETEVVMEKDERE